MRLKKLSFRLLLIAAAIVFIAGTAAHAQSHEPVASANSFSATLGDKVVALPAPEGFEEVASQFERMKTLFAASEPPASDLLAVYMPVSDGDLLRKGGVPGYKRYMKISIIRALRSYAALSSDFAASVDYIQKNNAQMFNPKRSQITDGLEQVDRAISKELSKDITIKNTQNTNLGDFDNRPNVYSNLMLLFFNSQIEGKEVTTPVVTYVNLLHIKQRIVMVFAYKRYESKADMDEMKQFTTKWINQILAAN